jgi:tRNA A-37 threonylcarbamoyl transferase component Bud32
VIAARGENLIGKTLGSCVLEGVLGQGGSSAVFLAYDQRSGHKVAVKVFLPREYLSLRMQKDFYRRFLHEAEAASKLDHPHIVPIYAYGEEDGLPYIVMPYMEGGTLANYMKERNFLSLSEAQWYLEQIAAAIDYAHEQGCIHCDIKPENILLDGNGVVKLSDFGIAHVIENGEHQPLVGIKVPDAVIGTPDYVSPEQALGQRLDRRSDVYSLAVTIFFLLTKSLPFKAETAIATALLRIHEPAPSLLFRRADVPVEVDRIIRRALEKDPEQRFQCAGDFCVAFIQAVAEGDLKRATDGVKEVDLHDDRELGILRKALSKLFLLVRSLSVVLRQCLVLHLILVVLAGLTVFSVIGTVWLQTEKDSEQLTGRETKGKANEGIQSDKLAQKNDWPISKTFFFDPDGKSYHILNLSPSSVAIAPYQGTRYSDFRLTVRTVMIRHRVGGSGYFGVVLRASSDQQNYYLFEISSDNHYLFWRRDVTWLEIASGSLPVLIDVYRSNTLFIEAHGNSFSFAVNGIDVVKNVSDSGGQFFEKGQIGLCVEDQGTEVAFSHLSIDTQP